MDAHFFEVLYENHHLRMFRIARKIIRAPDKAADLVQTVFLRLFNRETLLKSLSDQQLSVYLATCIRNASITAAKKREILVQDSDMLNLLDASAQHKSAEDEVFYSYSGGADFEQIHTALSALPEQYKDVLALRYRVDLSYSDIGDVMDISEGHARQIAYLARQQLRRLIGGGNDAE